MFLLQSKSEYDSKETWIHPLYTKKKKIYIKNRTLRFVELFAAPYDPSVEEFPLLFLWVASPAFVDGGWMHLSRSGILPAMLVCPLESSTWHFALTLRSFRLDLIGYFSFLMLYNRFSYWNGVRTQKFDFRQQSLFEILLFCFQLIDSGFIVAPFNLPGLMRINSILIVPDSEIKLDLPVVNLWVSLWIRGTGRLAVGGFAAEMKWYLWNRWWTCPTLPWRQFSLFAAAGIRSESFIEIVVMTRSVIAR